MTARRRIALLVAAVALVGGRRRRRGRSVRRRRLRAVGVRDHAEAPPGSAPALVRARLPHRSRGARSRAGRGPLRAWRRRGRGLRVRAPRLARGEGRRRLRRVAERLARPARAAREAVPRLRGRPAPPRARAAVGERRRSRRGLARGSRRGPGHAVRARGREPAAPGAPAWPARVHPVLLGVVLGDPPAAAAPARGVACGGRGGRSARAPPLRHRAPARGKARVGVARLRRGGEGVPERRRGASRGRRRPLRQGLARATPSVGSARSRGRIRTSRPCASIWASCSCGRAGSTRRSGNSASPRDCNADRRSRARRIATSRRSGKLAADLATFGPSFTSSTSVGRSTPRCDWQHGRGAGGAQL